MRRGRSIRRPGLLGPGCGNAHWHRLQGLRALAVPRRAFPVIGRALKSVGTRADLRRRRGRATPISVARACTYQGDVSVSARSEWNRACARCRTTTSTVARSAAQKPSRLARRPAATGPLLSVAPMTWAAAVQLLRPVGARRSASYRPLAPVIHERLLSDGSHRGS